MTLQLGAMELKNNGEAILETKVQNVHSPFVCTPKKQRTILSIYLLINLFSLHSFFFVLLSYKYMLQVNLFFSPSPPRRATICLTLSKVCRVLPVHIPRPDLMAMIVHLFGHLSPSHTLSSLPQT